MKTKIISFIKRYLPNFLPTDNHWANKNSFCLLVFIFLNLLALRRSDRLKKKGLPPYSS